MNPMQAPNVGPAGKDFGNRIINVQPVTIWDAGGDQYGNSRGVVHFLNFLTDIERDEYGGLFGDQYEYALKKVHAYMKKMYGPSSNARKFHNKKYGGGIIFTMPTHK